jgi:hypothetical protein
MHEVETVERMVSILDPSIHVSSARLTGMALDRCFLVDYLQFLRVSRDFELVSRDDSHH